MNILKLLLILLFWPIVLLCHLYKVIKAPKNNNKIVPLKSLSHTNKFPDIKPETKDILEYFQIPEPTRSLIWITNEETSKISSPLSIKIEFKLSKNGIETNTIDDSYNFYSEPSLIWTQLPLKPNSELETQKMYYPTYHNLSPIQRFQYLTWLTDISQDTNLSYVFLYYYGLERHLLLGNYDLAVVEILKLIKYHNKSSFKSYAINALIMGSGYRKRPDIVEKAPFVLDEMSPVSLYLRKMAQKPLLAENIISIASRVGFTNKRYLKLYPDLFTKELQGILDNYQERRGDILQNIETGSLKEDSWASIANISVPDTIRTIKFPSILESDQFKTILRELLNETHLRIKNLKANRV